MVYCKSEGFELNLYIRNYQNPLHRLESGHQLGKAYKVTMNKKIGKIMIAEGIDPIYALDWNLYKSDPPRSSQTPQNILLGVGSFPAGPDMMFSLNMPEIGPQRPTNLHPPATKMAMGNPIFQRGFKWTFQWKVDIP